MEKQLTLLDDLIYYQTMYYRSVMAIEKELLKEKQIRLRDGDMSLLHAVAEARKSGKTLVKLSKRHKS